MPDINCRVSRLEANHETLMETIEKMDKNLEKLTEQSTKQKGFIAGTTFALSAIISVVGWWWTRQ